MLAHVAFIISADELKKTLPGYDPAQSDKFHRVSAKLADQAYDRALKERPEPEVILLSGGAASGKTEYASVYLSSQRTIVVDGTLPSFEGAKIKIKKALRRGKRVGITAVMPENFNIAFSAFLGRERRFPPEHFFRTHSASRKALLEIAKRLPDIDINIIDSNYEQDGSMMFTRIVFTSRASMLELLRQRQYTEEEITYKITYAT